MDGYQARTQKKKQAIIEAARELFTRRGVSDVSVYDIAENSGVSHVSIYNYFGSKENLAVAALASYFDQVIAAQEEILERNLPFNEKFTRLMNYKYTKIKEATNPFFSSPAIEDEALQKVIREAAYKKAVPVYKRFIELGKKEGAIPQDIPTETILDYILHVMSILESKEYLQSSEEHKKGILHLVLYGLMGGSREEAGE